MLISKEALAQVDSELQRVIRAVTALTEGDHASPSVFEQAYIAGKVASDIGPDALKSMSSEQIQKWVSDHRVHKSSIDEARLRVLRDASAKWVAGMLDELTKRVRIELQLAEQRYAADVLSRSADGELRKVSGRERWAALRENSLRSLAAAVAAALMVFESLVDRFLQTELASYFQTGQTTAIASNEEVYKIPRLTACEHCLRLHVDENGAPRIYTLSDVEGKSNVGVKASSWSFVVGPVHPHCYCILYRVSRRVPVKSEALAAARAASLAIALLKRKKILEDAQAKYDAALRSGVN